MSNLSKLRLGTLGIALAAAAGLTACGGGGGGASTPMPSADAAASATVPGYLAFANDQIANNTSDTTEARDVDGITPPVTDTEEPAAI